MRSPSKPFELEGGVNDVWILESPESLVHKVFATDKGIRFCAVVDSNGEAEAAG